MTEDLLTRQDAWGGGFYELALEFPVASNDDLLDVLMRLWSYPALEGCYLKRDEELVSQKRITLNKQTETNLFLGQLLGIIDLPNGNKTNCLSSVIRELPTDEGGVTNWAFLNLPLGGLGYSYPFGGFPFSEDQKLEIHFEIDEMLKEIGQYIYLEEKFKLALIGFEIDTVPDYKEFIQGKIPEVRYSGCLKSSGSELVYFPATQ